MKQFLILIAFAIINVNAKAQSSTEVANIHHLKVTKDKGQLNINWQTANVLEEVNFEVQASVDGVTFTTIGYVLGANPAGVKGQYDFKQSINQLKPGLQQFRVLQQLTADTAVASEATRISK